MIFEIHVIINQELLFLYPALFLLMVAIPPNERTTKATSSMGTISLLAASIAFIRRETDSFA